MSPASVTRTVTASVAGSLAGGTVTVTAGRHGDAIVSALDALLVAGDETLRTLMTELLQGHHTRVCRCPDEVREELAERSYDLVVITNFGIPPSIAVDIIPIPAVRRYPVVFLTRHMDALLKHECQQRGIPWIEVPLEIEGILASASDRAGRSDPIGELLPGVMLSAWTSSHRASPAKLWISPSPLRRFKQPGEMNHAGSCSAAWAPGSTASGQKAREGSMRRAVRKVN